MQSLDDYDAKEAAKAFKDASAKVAVLQQRIKDEEQQAEAENREACPIQPLTAIPAAVIFRLCGSIKDASGEVAEIVASQRRACRELGNRPVYLLSEQLLAILMAAGIGGVNEKI